MTELQIRAKEKAEELINKFYPRCTSYASDRKNQKDNAKECAKIAVKEVIFNIDATILYHEEIVSLYANKTVWQEVLNQIEQL